MKAFLSHSSKDKNFVRQVAEQLGDMQVEFDEKTFEFTLNNRAIRNALSRCDVFVAFLSQNSVSSNFVAEEERSALEARGRGVIKECIVFCVDDTSYRQLPEWLRDLNVVIRASGPKACARKIQALLTSIDLVSNTTAELYLGRSEDERVIRRALAVPAKDTPLVLHAVGHPGIGRRTFLRNSLKSMYPRLFEVMLEVTVNQFSGVDDLYRSLCSLIEIRSINETINDFERFSKLDGAIKIEEISSILLRMAEDGEFVCLIDEGSVYTDDGDYEPHFVELISALREMKRPGICVVQTRMMPVLQRPRYPRSFHIYLRPLSDDAVREWLSLELKERGIDFEAADIEALSRWLDGHPFNVKFALKCIEVYGLPSIIKDPSDLIEWNYRRAEDFLRRIEFSLQQADIMAALLEYRYIAIEMLFSIFKKSSSELALDIRRLEEFCCVERRQDFCHISGPLREAVRRDKRFDRDDKWKQTIGSVICDAVREYEGEDSASVEILESATIAAVKGADAPKFLSNLILPSHLLRIARDFYDKRNWKSAAEFCQRAWELRGQLPKDAQVEALRLWGLASIRTGNQTAQEFVIKELPKYGTRVARRVNYFLRGFAFRISGDLDDAEKEFIEAYRISPNNESVNRELASLYCKQRQFVEAEKHARTAYERYPTNPFLIDVFAEALLGKQHQGLPVDRHEIDKVLADLQRYGDAPGSSFYLIRDAQQKARQKDTLGALKSIGNAIERTPELLAPYFMRANILLDSGDHVGAERDLGEIHRILNAAGGFSREDEAQAQELEAAILIEKRQYDNALDKINRSAFLANRVRKRLLNNMQRAISFEPDSASRQMQQWAKYFRS